MPLVPAMKPSHFLSKFSTISLTGMLQVDEEMVSWEFHSFVIKHGKLMFAALIFSQKSLDCDCTWIGMSIHFVKWIWIWIGNHIFVMD